MALGWTYGTIFSLPQVNLEIHIMNRVNIHVDAMGKIF